MYENNNYDDYNGTIGNYGACPETNPAKSSTAEDKEKKAFPTVLRKIGMMLVSGVAFGLAASLVCIGIIKASGMDAFMKSPDLSKDTEINEAVISPDEGISSQGKEGILEDTKEEASEEEATQSSQEEYTVAEIAQSCMPAIVSITNKSVEEVRSIFGTRQYESTGAGSGIIIGQNDDELLIASNNHVVANAAELSVCFGDDEDKVAEAKVKGMDAGNDLAILSVKVTDLTDEIKDTISIVKIGNSADVKVGDQVVAIGNALGYGQSVTTGIVSAKDRKVTIEGMTAKLIQTDAAINPGNSGGALLNMQGELIGINSSKFASPVVEGMGYAIPIDTAEPILQELMNRETRDVVDVKKQGYMGISCQNVSPEIAEMYHIPQGVYVLEVAKDGGAQKAGIQKGDIIMKFDGMTISDYDDLKTSLQYYEAGEKVEVVIMRAKEDGGYEEQTVTVTLTAAENNNSALPEETPNGEDNGNGQWEDRSAEDFFNEFFNYYNQDDGMDEFFFGR